MNWLRLVHALGLTNLSDANVRRYEELDSKGAASSKESDNANPDRLDLVATSVEPPRSSEAHASNAAKALPGINIQDTSSALQRLPGSVSPRSPESERFGDQLAAVLPRLRRFARGLSESVADADDLIQAACKRALARQHQFQEGTRLDSWMFRIVQTIWIDQVRSRDMWKEDGAIAADRLGSDEPVRPVEARLTLEEERRALDRLPPRALDRLPPDQRVAFLLVTVEGLSYEEAAEVVQVPVGTIMSRLARSRIALRLQLEAGHGGHRGTKDAGAK